MRQKAERLDREKRLERIIERERVLKALEKSRVSAMEGAGESSRADWARRKARSEPPEERASWSGWRRVEVISWLKSRT